MISRDLLQSGLLLCKPALYEISFELGQLRSKKPLITIHIRPVRRPQSSLTVQGHEFYPTQKEPSEPPNDVAHLDEL
jgi:hypothetical protein